MQTSSIKVFSPVPVRGSNYDIGINHVLSILRTNFISKYTFSVIESTIYIENLETKSKDCVFTYQNQMNYATTPWTISKELTFKQYYSCGNSEQSVYNPSESEIIEFAQRMLIK